MYIIVMYLYGGQRAKVKKSSKALMTSAPLPRCCERIIQHQNYIIFH